MIGAGVLVSAALAWAPVVGIAPDDAIVVGVRACERWLLEPETWIDGIAAFPRASGLAGRGLEECGVPPEAALPPPSGRDGLHFWVVRAGAGVVYATTSDRMPACHVVAMGLADGERAVRSALARRDLLDRWYTGETKSRAGLSSTAFTNVEDAKLTMVISRPGSGIAAPEGVQILATVQYQIGN